MQTQQEIANDWVRYAETYWWEPDWFENKDRIKLRENLQQVLNNLEIASKNNDIRAAFREIERIRDKAITTEPFHYGVALRRCGQVALQMGFVVDAAELFRKSQNGIGTENDHHFAVMNWMEGCVAWLRPRSGHNLGINRWQECMDIFKDLSESGGVMVSNLEWYRRQRIIMATAHKYAIENDKLPPVWVILEQLEIPDEDFGEEGEKEKDPSQPITTPEVSENYFDLFVVYDEIQAGMPVPSGFVPTSRHPVHPDLEPDKHIEVTQVRVGGQEYSLHSIRKIGKRINLARNAEHFVLQVRGNSMNLAGIDHGDLVLCRAQASADHEDIVAIAFDLKELDLDLDYLSPLKKLQMIMGPGSELPTTLKRFEEQADSYSIRAESDDSLFDEFDVEIPKSMMAAQDKIVIYGIAVAVLKPIP